MPQITRGFSLAELLVALATLGLISALTLPKIFMGVVELQKKAVLTESYTIIQKLYMNNFSNGGMFIRQAQLNTLNATRICGGIAADNMVCETASISGEDNDLNNQGVILPTGAHVWGINPDRSSYDIIMIDWNGHNGENTIGDDIIKIGVCINPEDTLTAPSYSCSANMGSSTAGSIKPSDTASNAMFDYYILNKN
jgi:prepilin-type N-terminal cleavage/methylation domain-containing protein